MHDFKSKIKAVSRRISYLRGKIESNSSDRSVSYDKAEMQALSDLIKVAAIYEEARGQGGSHVENTLCLARDVLDDLMEQGTIPEDQAQRVQTTWEKLNHSITALRKISSTNEEP